MTACDRPDHLHGGRDLKSAQISRLVPAVVGCNPQANSLSDCGLTGSISGLSVFGVAAGTR